MFMLGRTIIMGKKIDTRMVDRISQLPTSILHDILFFLPGRDAARTCILSKSWNRLVWSSLPVLSFNFSQHNFFQEHQVLCIEERQDQFINFVEDSLQRLHRERVKILKFRLQISLFNSKIASFIDHWLALVANNYVQDLFLIILLRGKGNNNNWYNFPKIAFAAAGLLKILYLRGCKLQQNSFFDDDERARPLFIERLNMINVVTDNQDCIVQNFISRCPFIEYMRIDRCLGMKNLQLSNHPKLKEIKVKLQQRGNGKLFMPERIEVDVLTLQTINYSGLCNRPLVVDATRCRNLRHLSLNYTRIQDDHLFQNLVSYFPLLVSLALFHCYGLKKVSTLSHSSLKKLVVRYNDLYNLAVIDTPHLLSFTFSDDSVPSLVSINAACSSLLQVAKVFLCPVDRCLDTLWFLDLREFLGQIGKQIIIMVLKIRSRAYEFIAEELTEFSIPDLSYDIEHLWLVISRSSVSYAALVDGLLWSCHPKTLTVTSRLKSNNNFMKLLCEILIKREEVPACCDSCHIKCWRHYLKDVMIDSIVGTTDAKTYHNDAMTLESLLPTLTTCKKIVLKLSWV